MLDRGNPKSDSRMNRRRMLQTVGGAGLGLAFAGCLGDDDDDSAPADDSDDADQSDDDDETGDDGDDAADDVPEYPTQSPELIIPFGEGGGTDTIWRSILPYFEDELGESVQINNVSGAGSLRGTGEAHMADPDGYTLLAFNPPSTPITYLINPQDWDITEFRGIAGLAEFQLGLHVRAEDDIDDLNELIEATEGGEYTDPGVGSDWHAASMFFMREQWGWEWENIIPYGGSGDNLSALVGGEIDISLTTMSAAAPFLESGDIKTVLVAHSVGSDIAPDAHVPAAEDEWENFDFVAGGIRALWAPPETPDYVIETLSEVCENILEDDDLRTVIEDGGDDPMYRSPEEMDDTLQSIINDVPEQVDLDEIEEVF